MADLATIEQQMSTAIGQQETSGGTAGVGLSLDNPGGLKYADWETQYGATPGANGFAQFPDLASGWKALTARLDQLIQGGASLSSLMNTYSPPSDGNSNNAQRVGQLAATTGLDPSKPITSQVSASPTSSLIPPDVSDNANPDTQYMTADAAKNPSAYQGGSTWGRVAAFLVGLLCLVMGILLLKQSQVVIEQAGKVAATAATAV